MNAREYDNWRTDNGEDDFERKLAKVTYPGNLFEADEKMFDIGREEDWAEALAERMFIEGHVKKIEESYEMTLEEIAKELSDDSVEYLLNLAYEMECNSL